ncbi:MAG: hypothetical protein ACFN0X_05915 [Mitsuokella sp.]
MTEEDFKAISEKLRDSKVHLCVAELSEGSVPVGAHGKNQRDRCLSDIRAYCGDTAVARTVSDVSAYKGGYRHSELDGRRHIRF